VFSQLFVPAVTTAEAGGAQVGYENNFGRELVRLLTEFRFHLFRRFSVQLENRGAMIFKSLK
jgi:hypothetical protein